MRDILKTYKHWFLLLTYGIVLFLFLSHIQVTINALFYLISLFMPFIIGLCIAFVLNVVLQQMEHLLANKLNNKPKLKRAIALLLTLLIVFGSLVGIMFFVLPELGRTIALFVKQTPTYLSIANEFALSLLKQWNIDPNMIPNISINWSKVWEMLVSFLQSGGLTVFKVTTGIFDGILNMFLGIVFAAYILIQKETFQSQTSRFMKAYLPQQLDQKIRALLTLSSNTFSNFITGQFFEAILLGTLCFIGMMIIQIPYALTISVLIGFTALIPIVGALIGTSIGMLLIVTIDPLYALIFLIYILILQWVDNNFIYPRVVGKSVSLPGVWVLLAITVGGSAFGVFGMIVAVPTCSIIYTLVRQNVQKRLEIKGETNEKNTYS